MVKATFDLGNSIRQCVSLALCGALAIAPLAGLEIAIAFSRSSSFYHSETGFLAVVGGSIISAAVFFHLWIVYLITIIFRPVWRLAQGLVHIVFHGWIFYWSTNLRESRAEPLTGSEMSLYAAGQILGAVWFILGSLILY
jgi:hypothetical protein